MFNVDIEDSAVNAALTALVGRAIRAQPMLQAIGEDVTDRTKARFATGTAPDGTPWKANAPSTIAGKGPGKGPLIGESGDLRREFHVNAVVDAVTIGNSMIYAAIQQLGGQAGRGRAVTIAARPSLPIRQNGELYPDERARILATLRSFLMGE